MIFQMGCGVRVRPGEEYWTATDPLHATCMGCQNVHLCATECTSDHSDAVLAFEIDVINNHGDTE